jgi:hypothetical protein
MRFLFLAAAIAALASPPAGAQTAAPAAPAVRTLTCPIGGGSFTFTAVAPPLVTGERPDGRPYGNVSFPLKLPECPDNGLVFYKDYDAAEVAKLEGLVSSEAFQALRKEDTQYYRAYWLMREMGEPPERYLWALLQASWEAEGRPELRKRYLAELAESSAKVPPRPKDLGWIGMEGRAINALRELGRFDEATARLDKGAAGRPRRPRRGRRRHWAGQGPARLAGLLHQDQAGDPAPRLLARAARPAAPKRRLRQVPGRSRQARRSGPRLLRQGVDGDRRVPRFARQDQEGSGRAAPVAGGERALICLPCKCGTFA